LNRHHGEERVWIDWASKVAARTHLDADNETLSSLLQKGLRENKAQRIQDSGALTTCNAED